MALCDTITSLPLISNVTSDPIWLPALRNDELSLSTDHRQSYQGHFHSTKIPGHPNCLINRSRKPDVSAYRSTLPLSSTQNKGSETRHKDQYWLEHRLESRNLPGTNRRGDYRGLLSSGDWFMPDTHYRTFFPPKVSEKLPNFQPKHVPVKSTTPFDSVSTYSSEYMRSQLPYKSEDIRYSYNKSANNNILVWQEHQRSQMDHYKRKSSLAPLEKETSYRNEFLYRRPDDGYRLYGPPVVKHKCTMIYQGKHNTDTTLPGSTNSTYQDTYSDSSINGTTGLNEFTRHSSVGALQREALAAESEGNMMRPVRDRTKVMFTGIQH